MSKQNYSLLKIIGFHYDHVALLYLLDILILYIWLIGWRVDFVSGSCLYGFRLQKNVQNKREKKLSHIKMFTILPCDV